jgi:probable RNA-binding protein EIF1AD
MAMQKKNIIQEFMADSDFLPSDNQLIVRYVSGKGNNLHEVECPSVDLGAPAKSTFFLVSMPKKFRQLVWLRKGDCIVIDPIAEGKKVLGEIICVLPLKSVMTLIENGHWPPISNETKSTDPEFAVQLKTQFLNFFQTGLPKSQNGRSSPASSGISSDSSENDSDTEESDGENDDEGTGSEEELEANTDSKPIPGV